MIELARSQRDIEATSRKLERLKSIALQYAKLIHELTKRQAEGLALYIPLAAAIPFHASRAKFRLAIGSNQSGKTTVAAAEVAMVVCGLDPHGKFPVRDGKAFAVGLDERHLAQPMLEKLIRPGAFSCIHDEHTGLLRAVRVDPDNPTQLDPYDDAYREKWVDSPPLLSPRFCDPNKPGQIKWADKGGGVPEFMNIPSTGWNIAWRSSKASAEQGTQKHLAWFDEHLEDPLIFDEFRRGSMRYGGKLIWSATPQRLNVQLTDLRDKAIQGDPDTHLCQLLIADNPFIPEKEKQSFFNMLSPEEREVRWYGKAAADVRQVYRDFNAMGLHGCDPFPIPDDWAVYMAVDPGAVHCATLFAAIDPEEKHVWIYDGWDLRYSHAEPWALQVKATLGSRPVEAVIFDSQMGRQKVVGESKTRFERYSDALKAVGIVPRVKSPEKGFGGFWPGSPNIASREAALVSWLQPRMFGFGMGTPKLKVFRGKIPDLERQILKAIRATSRTGDMNVRNDKRDKNIATDLLDCLEYLAGSEDLLVYRKPEIEPSDNQNAWAEFLAKRKRQDDRRGVVF